MSDPALVSGRPASGGRLRTAGFLWLRIGLALSVVLAHFGAISGDAHAVVSAISSLFAVQAFFVISGWIVAASCDRSASLLGFWGRRVARLYPLYVAVVATQALVALMLSAGGLERLPELARYLAVNLAFANFLQPSLFGLLADAPVLAINPSLWTLKIEVMFYLLVPLLVLFHRARGARALLWLYLASSAFYYLTALRSEVLSRQFAGQLRYFVAGMVCWQLAAAGFARRRSAWQLAPVALLALYLGQRFEHVYALGVVQPLLVATFVYAAAHALSEPRRVPDISYGLYILHAPLMQLGFQLGLWQADARGLALAVGTTTLLAIATWYGLERPAIRAAKRWLDRAEARDHREAIAPQPRQLTL